MKRISFKRLSVLFGLLLIIGLISPISVLADDFTSSLNQNTEGQYVISSPEDFAKFRTDLANYSYADKCYLGKTVILTNDIDITNVELGTTGPNVFFGTLDGQGHTVTCNQAIGENKSLVPTNKGSIKNLSLVINREVDSTKLTTYNFGNIAENNYGTIEYVTVKGTITLNSDSVVGQAVKLTEKSEWLQHQIAGIAGTSALANAKIENCGADIQYTLTGNNISEYQNTEYTSAIQLYQICALVDKASIINNCYALGAYSENLLFSQDLKQSGLIIGICNFDSTINGMGKIYYNADQFKPYRLDDEYPLLANPDNSTKVIGVTTSELKTQATFVGWDFDKIWNIAADKNNGYPYLDVRTVVKNLKVKPVFEEKIWNDGSDLTAKVTGMEFAGLSEAEKALVEKYKITINFDPINDVKSAAFKSMQNLGWRDVTVEYNTQPTITVGETDAASTDGYTFVFDGVVTGQARIVDNGTPGPGGTEQVAQIAKAKEANTIIFEKYIGDGSTYLTPLTVIGDLAGEKIFLQDLWAMFSAARGDYYPGGDKTFYDKWFANVKTSLHTLKEGGLKKEDMKVTEWTKLVMAITAAGYDARDIEDYDLIDIISDKNMLDKNKILQEQTAYLALIGGGYEMTAATPITDSLAALGKSGAEHLNGYPDASVTNGDNAMFFQHLGFFLDDPDVKAATEHYMYDRVGGDNPLLQNGDGSFTTIGYPLNAWNNAQMMIALGCFDMNVFDEHFIQNGNTVLDSQFKLIDFENRNYGDMTYEITQLTRGFTAVIRQYEGRNQIFVTSDIVGATKAVNDQLNALSKTSSTEDLTAAKKAYDDLSDAKKASIGKNNKEKITALGVVELINKLPKTADLKAQDKADVMAVRAAYKALTSQQAKDLVTNLTSLETLETELAKLLDGKIVTDQGSKIEVVGLPAGVSVLKVEPKITDDNLKKVAEDAAKKEGLGDVTIISLYDIKPDMSETELEKFNQDPNTYVTIVLPIPEGQQGAANYRVYHQKSDGSVEWITPVLSEDGKSLILKVSSFSTFGITKSLSADEIAAKVIIDQISALPAVDQLKLADEAAVVAARSAFNGLSTEQQKLVINSGTLTAAETQIGVLKNAGSGGNPGGPTEQPKDITITVDVERFTIGQGFYVEPTSLTIKEGDTARQAIEKLLGAENLVGDVGYIRAVKGADTGSATIPQYIVDELNGGDSNAANAYKQKYDGSTLGEFDYSSYAGWMYFVNNVTPSVGLNAKKLQNGDVLRLAFTYWATGGDLTGNGYIGSGINRTPISLSFIPANKDGLIKAIAKVNGNTAYLQDTAIKTAYDDAMTTVQDMTASLVKTNDITTALTKAIADYKPGNPNNPTDDTKIAKAVTDQIAALPAVAKLALTDKTAITAARAAYDALSEAQKKLVTNLNTLAAAEAKIVELQTAADKVAAKGVTDKIAALPAVAKLVLTDKDAVAAARAAYDALSEAQKKLVINLSTLTAAEAKIAELQTAADKAAAKGVTDKIAALPAVAKLVLTDKDAVAAARAAYDALSEVQKKLVTNLNTLAAAEAKIVELQTAADKVAAKGVTDKIAALPAVAKLVLTDKDAVAAARAAYDALSEAQKKLVTNLNTLAAAEAKITELQTAADKVAAKAVTDKIAVLPAVAKLVLTDKDAVAAARAAYDALSEAQKKLVTNLDTLTAVEAQMTKLLAGEATEADKAAAKVVSGQIAGLPSGDKLTLGSKADVAAARSAYNALTDIQKTLITNLDALAAAETRIAELEAATPPAKNEATGIEMVGLPEGVGLKVEPESGDATKTDEAEKAATEAGIKDAKVVSLYSIKPDMSADDLAKFNSDPDSFVTLTMPLGDDQQGYDNYKIYHKKTDGTVEWITPTLSADGKSLIFKVNAFSEFGVVATKASTEIPTVDFSYRTHVQNVGWQDWKNNGAMSGTQGQSLRLEGIEIKRADTADVDLGIRYETHIENIGWEDRWKADGKMSGTEGQSLRLEAIRIELTGADAESYDVYYQVHAQNTGWMAFAKNGENAGTAGFAYRLEGIHVVVVPKGQPAPTPEAGSIDSAFLVKN